MQMTNASRKILSNEKGELKNHYLTLTREELNDSSNNICAGVRWLFRKREVAASLLKRAVSWEDAVYEYKGCRTVSKARAKKLMDEFNETLRDLSKCAK